MSPRNGIEAFVEDQESTCPGCGVNLGMHDHRRDCELSEVA